MTELRSVTFKVSQEMYEQIQLIADKRGETLSAVIRSLITRGLTERICEENTDLIAQVVRAEIENVVKMYAITQVKDESDFPELPYNIASERLMISRKNTNPLPETGNNKLSRYHWLQSLRRTSCPAN